MVGLLGKTITVTFLIRVSKNSFSQAEYITWVHRDTKLNGFVPVLVLNVCINQYCVILMVPPVFSVAVAINPDL